MTFFYIIQHKNRKKNEIIPVKNCNFAPKVKGEQDNDH